MDREQELLTALQDADIDAYAAYSSVPLRDGAAAVAYLGCASLCMADGRVIAVRDSYEMHVQSKDKDTCGQIADKARAALEALSVAFESNQTVFDEATECFHCTARFHEMRTMNREEQNE